MKSYSPPQKDNVIQREEIDEAMSNGRRRIRRRAKSPSAFGETVALPHAAKSPLSLHLFAKPRSVRFVTFAASLQGFCRPYRTAFSHPKLLPRGSESLPVEPNRITANKFPVAHLVVSAPLQATPTLPAWSFFPPSARECAPPPLLGRSRLPPPTLARPRWP